MIRQGSHARRSLIGAARELRKRETTAERVLWAMLRRQALFGFKFRRQHQIGEFVVDFYCAELKLAVEMDGKGHLGELQAKLDVRRTEELQHLGLTILRFENEDAVVNPSFVREQISRVIGELKRLRTPNGA
ncbi:MAG TPA: endonuclease domain-containing protein [Thermoanaerobaculia bacterium]|nr:endonuclease domain-containing protein [Thermoanaerobaculia bacterium]